jgi:putative ABC transport system substrate-binding protein
MIRRRELIAFLAGTVAAWPLAARAQQTPPVIAFVSVLSVAEAARYDAAFRKGLTGRGIIEGQNATIEYHWLDGQYEQLPSLMADLVRRRVALIATPGSAPAALAAKAVTATIPIVFSAGVDPVQAGLVASLSRPEANLTGINFFSAEVTAKRLGLLHELLPKAARVAVLINPGNPANSATALRELPEAARTLGWAYRFSMPAPFRRSMRLSRALRASGLTPFLSVPNRTSSAGGFRLRRSGRATPFRRLLRFATVSRPER